MENNDSKEIELNKKAYQDYYKKYADARSIPLLNHKLNSLFHTARTSLDEIRHEDVVRWLKSPELHYGRLIDMSRDLYKTSGEYRSLLNYHINMARFYHSIEPVYSSNAKMSKETAMKNLSKISLQIEKMNLKHELSKVVKTCFVEDVFFGYEIEDNDNYFLLKLDPHYCRIVGIADGMYTFAFNLAYFEGNKLLLDSFPDEFKLAYNQYLTSKDPLKQWFEPSFTKSVCFKMNENTPDIIPPFAVMFEPLLELNDYKKLKKVGAKINNYMLLHQKVPIHDNNKGDYQADNFAISIQSMEFFNEMVNENLPEEIGAIVSPMEINPIKLDKDDKNDKVQEATRDVYNASGVSAFLFNNDKNSTGGLMYSVRKDEMLVINFYRQIERWLNRKIRFGGWLAKNQWRISLLDVTGLSEDKYLEQLNKSGTLGFPVRGKIAAMHGLDYHTLLTSLELENDFLDLDEIMIPLASTHTGGINKEILGNKGGRPQKAADELSDSGQVNRDSNSTTEVVSEGGESNNDE